MQVAVVVASLGRPKELGQLSQHLAKQSRQPDQVIFSVVSENDLPERHFLYPNSEVIFSPKGSCVQRNRAIDLSMESTLTIFMDDDYVPTSTMIEDVIEFFNINKDCIGVTGHLIADGVNSPGISYEKAVELVDAFENNGAEIYTTTKTLRGLYGCNMAFKTSAIKHVRFDENLPLYGWQEDIDFAANAMKGGGLLAKTNQFSGVHRGAKGGRTSGVRLGYSQVANPIYLSRKGTMRFGFAIKILLKNMVANHLKAVRPEPWVDRIGRIKGNWLAVCDLIKGKSSPSRILDL